MSYSSELARGRMEMFEAEYAATGKIPFEDYRQGYPRELHVIRSDIATWKEMTENLEYADWLRTRHATVVDLENANARRAWEMHHRKIIALPVGGTAL